MMVTLCQLKKLLIIDDDMHTNYLTEYRFKKMNVSYELKFKSTVEDAMQFLSKPTENSPDLILLDINLPVLDGWDFLDWYGEVHEHDHLSKTLIYILSTSVYDGDKKRAGKYSYVSGFIEKPLKIQHIKDIESKHFPY